MTLGNGIELNYGEGKLKLEVAVAAMAMPVLEDLEAKVESGQIDPIKGTDLDKAALLQVINFLEAQVGGGEENVAQIEGNQGNSQEA